jgi:hypothetical protein
MARSIAVSRVQWCMARRSRLFDNLANDAATGSKQQSALVAIPPPLLGHGQRGCSAGAGTHAVLAAFSAIRADAQGLQKRTI